jgi:flagellar biosynthesis protein FlhB
VIVGNPPLARALYRCAIDRPIPDALYEPVAEVYRAMRERRAQSGAEAAHA